MLELATGAGLALAAGLNAWIPLLALGLLARFTDLISLPDAWSWLENPWVLGIFGVLLALEMVGDKVPVVDTVSDMVQTVIRPGAGGIAFSAGAMSETVQVEDPATFIESGAWVPAVIGIAIALAVHLAKAGLRAAANAVTAGVAAPVLSTTEDAGAVGLSLAAIMLPVLVIPIAVAMVVLAWWALRTIRRRRRERAAREVAAVSDAPSG